MREFLGKLWLGILRVSWRVGKVVAVPAGSPLIVEMDRPLAGAELERMQARAERFGIRVVVFDDGMKLAGYIEAPPPTLVMTEEIDVEALKERWRRATITPGGAAERAERPARPSRPSASTAGPQGGTLRRRKV